MESKCRKWLYVLYMVGKFFCDVNYGDNDNGDGDDANIRL